MEEPASGFSMTKLLFLAETVKEKTANLYALLSQITVVYSIAHPSFGDRPISDYDQISNNQKRQICRAAMLQVVRRFQTLTFKKSPNQSSFRDRISERQSALHIFRSSFRRGLHQSSIQRNYRQRYSILYRLLPLSDIKPLRQIALRPSDRHIGKSPPSRRIYQIFNSKTLQPIIRNFQNAKAPISPSLTTRFESGDNRL